MSDYMSINDETAKREAARRVGVRFLLARGYEILEGGYMADGEHDLIVATDPEDGSLVFAACYAVDEFAEGAMTARALFENAAFGWLAANPGQPEALVRFDEVQVRPLDSGGKAFVWHARSVELDG